jgi:hypothetical protein
MQLFSKNQLQNFRQNKKIDYVAKSMTKEEEACNVVVLNSELAMNPRKVFDQLHDSRESFNKQAQEIIPSIPVIPLQFIHSIPDK